MSSTPSPFGETRVGGGRDEHARVPEDEGRADRALTAVRGTVEERSVEGDGRRAPAVEGHRANGPESHHGAGELRVRETGAVPRLPPVDRNEDHATVPELAHRASGRPRNELERREPLVRARDGGTAPNELRTAADGGDDVGPARHEVEAKADGRTDLRLGGDRRAERAGADEHGAARRNGDGQRRR